MLQSYLGTGPLSEFSLKPKAFKIFGILFVLSVSFWSAPEVNAKDSLEKELESSLGAANSTYEMARAYFAQKDFKKVIDLISPQVTEATRPQLILLGRSYTELNDHSSAIKVYQALLSKKENDFEVQTLIGDAYFASSKKATSETLNAYKNALDANPKYEPAYIGLAKYYERAKNPYELRNLYQDLVDKVAVRKDYVTKLCQLNFEASLYDNAKKYCRLGKTKFPEVPENHVNFASVEKIMGDPKTGDRLLKGAADKFGNSEFANWTYAAMVDEKKDFITAYKYYGRAYKADKSSDRSRLGFAICAFELKKYPEALEAYSFNCKAHRQTQAALRKALLALKTNKVVDWITRYEAELEKCSPTSVGF